MCEPLRIILPSTIVQQRRQQALPVPARPTELTLTPGQKMIQDFNERLDQCWSYAASLSHRLLVCDEATLRTVADVLPSSKRPQAIPQNCMTVNIKQAHAEAFEHIQDLQTTIETPATSFTVECKQDLTNAILDSLEDMVIAAGKFVINVADLNHGFSTDGYLIQYKDSLQMETLAVERSRRARDMFEIKQPDTGSRWRLMAEQDPATGEPFDTHIEWDDNLSPVWSGPVSPIEPMLSPLWPAPTSPLEAFPALPEPIRVGGQDTYYQSFPALPESLGEPSDSEWAASFPVNFASSRTSPNPSHLEWASSFPSEFESAPSASQDELATSSPADFSSPDWLTPPSPTREATFPLEFASSQPSAFQWHEASLSSGDDFPFNVSWSLAEPWLDHGICKNPLPIKDDKIFSFAPSPAQTARRVTAAVWALTLPRRCAKFDKTGRCNHCQTAWRRHFVSSPSIDSNEYNEEIRCGRQSKRTQLVAEDQPQSYFARSVAQFMSVRNLIENMSTLKKPEDLILNDSGIHSRVCFTEMSYRHTLYAKVTVEGYGYAELKIAEYMREDDPKIVERLDEFYRDLLFEVRFDDETEDCESNDDEGLFTLDLFDETDDESSDDGYEAEDESSDDGDDDSDDDSGCPGNIVVIEPPQNIWDTSIAGAWMYSSCCLQ